MALPGRKAFEIRFPVVEGYVVSLQRNLVTADVSKVEKTKLDPCMVPTDALIRPQVGYQFGHASAHGGFGFELVNRQEYYDSVHLQTIEFDIAREIVRALTEASHPGKERLRRESRSTLFFQVLQIVQRYMSDRVDFNGLNPCEVGLQTYAQRIIALLIAAITLDDGKNEAPLLPRLNRSKPIDSPERVRFKMVKPVQVTAASHLNYVACDTNSWEQAATFQLEKLAEGGIVYCYARWAIQENWHFVHPNFRGPNDSPEAMGSDLAVHDIVDAVRGMQKRGNVDASRIYLIGCNGGWVYGVAYGRSASPDLGGGFCMGTGCRYWHVARGMFTRRHSE
jgi:type III restriction enzyme